MTWKLYRIPYYWDEADEAYPLKYINDMAYISTVMIEQNGTIDAILAIKATDAQHAELASHDDVEVLDAA